MRCSASLALVSMTGFFAMVPMTSIQAADTSSPLSIRRVVLYKHGVGYFERQGRVTDQATLSLRFKQDEMSDVLKSLTVLDRGGGNISTIAYDSQKPADQLLSEFAFNLRTGDVRKAMLEQLRGASIRVKAAGHDDFSGAILGLDTRSEERDGTKVEMVSVSLLTDAGEIVTLDLADLRSFQFEDEELAAEVSRYLALLRTTHRRDEKEMQLVCDGTGPRSIFASYVVEQPVWKATYRMVLFENDQKPYLQGWAVVDNPSEEDWVDVDLSLVSGMPVSFRQDLYTPRFHERPWLKVEEDAMISFAGLKEMGKVADRAVQQDKAMLSERRRAAPMVAGGAFRGVPDAAAAEAAFDEDFSMGSEMASVEMETISREIGDLLEYRIDHKVTIPRNRSALLPIVGSGVEGGRIALYNEQARANNPMSAVRVVNTTGVTLEGGPVTVLEGDTYAGESMIDTLKPNERRYIPYAVELGVKATTKYGTDSERVYRVEVANGIMRSFYKDVSQKTYAFDNRNERERTVMVEHPKRNGYELRAPKEPTETELDRYRFEIVVAAKERGELVVEEERVRDRSYQISNVDSDTIAFFQRGGQLTPELQTFLQQVVLMKREIDRVQDDMNRRQAELVAIAANQDRIRKNLAALGGSAEEKDLRRDYVEQLRGDEESVQRLKGEITKLENDLQTRRDALNQHVRSATFSFDTTRASTR